MIGDEGGEYIKITIAKGMKSLDNFIEYNIEMMDGYLFV